MLLGGQALTWSLFSCSVWYSLISHSSESEMKPLTPIHFCTFVRHWLGAFCRYCTALRPVVTAHGVAGHGITQVCFRRKVDKEHNYAMIMTRREILSNTPFSKGICLGEINSHRKTS